MYVYDVCLALQISALVVFDTLSVLSFFFCLFFVCVCVCVCVGRGSLVKGMVP